uniref:Phage protein n=1 Tax=Angiostrongylus cantonensis TaxID=6313 RepID=A0A0K0D0I4_ANGCA
MKITDLYNGLQEDLTDYVAHKVAAAMMGHDERWERFILSKYVAIQLTEDFFAPNHSLVMPYNVTNAEVTLFNLICFPREKNVLGH